MFRLLAPLVVFLSLALPSLAEDSKSFQWLDETSLSVLAERAAQEQKVLLLLFGTPGCPHANQVVETINRSEPLRRLLGDLALTARLDMNENHGVRLDQSPLLLANHLGLRGSPTLVLIRPYGGAFKRAIRFGEALFLHEGEITAEALRNALAELP